MTVQIRRLQFRPPQFPTEVRIVLSDAETKEEAQVWISARFPVEQADNDRLPVLSLGVLRELQNLIDEGREHASQPPAARKQ